MKKKTQDWDFEEDENKKEFDPEVLKRFMTEGVDLKDEHPVDETAEVVDLHFEKISSKEIRYSEDEKLQIQIALFEKQLDNSILAGKKKLIVIHGKGTGKLKQQVVAILKEHPMVKSWRSLEKNNRDAFEILFLQR